MPGSALLHNLALSFFSIGSVAPGQLIHAYIQSNLIECLDRKIISCLLAFDLPYEIVRQTNGLRQLRGGHFSFFAVLFDVASDHIIDTIAFRTSIHRLHRRNYKQSMQ